MPRLDESGEALLHAGQDARKRVQRAWDGFLDFALRDNVLEVAVGLIIASAFTAVVSSFVSDILLPPISLIPIINKNLNEKFAVLRGGSHYERGKGYNTLKQAMDDGAVVMAYGSFVDKVVRLLFIGLTLYIVGQTYGWVSNESVIKRTVKCKYCRKSISEKASTMYGMWLTSSADELGRRSDVLTVRVGRMEGRADCEGTLGSGRIIQRRFNTEA